MILICVLPTPRDLEIARLLGWYRPALRSAPKVAAVDYLPFDQPSSFGDWGGRIELAASLRSGELTRRRELLKDGSEHPCAGGEYSKIQIGGLEKSSNSIVADPWKHLAFSDWAGECLLKARTWNDRFVNADGRAGLRRSWRARAEDEQLHETDLPEGDVPPEGLIVLVGITAEASLYDLDELD